MGSSIGTAHLSGSACLKVSSAEFVELVREVIDILEQVSSMLSKFSSGLGNFCISHAIADCLDLCLICHLMTSLGLNLLHKIPKPF
ncbi:hypothetical protein TanjilG_14058 [Lupinus angustifolius]|uniref:Uncharacterized protein n=1 Tax=Lupinus angustifolius TaxID=3871 RepID=A0A394DBU6_LUPAN|nr:hypothetical protein TanjilG_14058 [Lupinus angustifolius]